MKMRIANPSKTPSKLRKKFQGRGWIASRGRSQTGPLGDRRMSGIIESRGEIVNWFYEFEPSVKFANGLRKAIRYAVRSKLRCLMPYLPSKGELLDEIERSRGRTAMRKFAVKTGGEGQVIRGIIDDLRTTLSELRKKLQPASPTPKPSSPGAAIR